MLRPTTISPFNLRAPKQARSHATLARICTATERLLEKRHWHELTIAEIAAEARSSIGSFYARFADKEALLDHLDERYSQEMLALCAELVSLGADRTVGLEPYTRRVIDDLVAFHRRRKGLVRALVLRARTFRESAYDQRTDRMNRTAKELVGRIAERLPARLGRHRSRRAFLAVSFMFSALRDRILFPESVADPGPPAKDDLGEELSRSMLAYLGAAAPSGD
jgi:AcrR family transcriptional regulator